jgi:fatty-acid peroxygenase
MASHIDPPADAFATRARGRPLPRLPHGDHSASLLADPYRFIAQACRAAGADAVETRLLMQPTICMTGVRAAALFYDTERFQRAGAAPEPLRATLFGKAGVQGLDDRMHMQRKALFLEVTDAASVAQLVQAARRGWAPCLARWGGTDRVPLYAVAQDWLMTAACAWLGLTVPPQDRAHRRRQTVALFDSAASGVLRHLRTRWDRRQAEDWLARMVAEERRTRGRLRAGSPAHAVAWHRDANGSLLRERVAAVELLNLLRPIVAVSVFVVFLAHALESDVVSRAVVSDGDDPRYLLAFVQEVRRRYPFFPMVAARTRCAFERHAGPLRHQPRRTPLGTPGGVHAGALPLGAGRHVRLGPAGRGRAGRRPSLPWRRRHDRPDETGHPPAGARDALPPAAAGPAAGHAASAGTPHWRLRRRAIARALNPLPRVGIKHLF